MHIDSQVFEFCRPEWQQHALCHGRTNEFFAQQMTTSQKTALKAICQQCLVRTECLELALSFEIDNDGVFAGSTPRERQAIRNERLITTAGESA
jgi:hypothetical protein